MAPSPFDAAHIPLGGGREFDVIRELLDEWGAAAHGIGDDAAVLQLPAGQRLVVSTDASVERVHFRREWLTAEEVGARAATAAMSDLAAMAATPVGLLLALAVPIGWDRSLREVARGVGRTAARAGCPIVGGNLSRASELSLTITVLGTAAHPVSRRGACAGDAIFVTGRLGGPGAALLAFRDGTTPNAEHRARFAAPAPRLGAGRWLAERSAHAAIDVSDGLIGDAAHLALASGVSITLDERAIPCLPGVSVKDALVSGEEYELLVALPGGATIDCGEFEQTFGIPLTRIGTATAAGTPSVRFLHGRTDNPRGHDHLA